MGIIRCSTQLRDLDSPPRSGLGEGVDHLLGREPRSFHFKIDHHTACDTWISAACFRVYVVTVHGRIQSLETYMKTELITAAYILSQGSMVGRPLKEQHNTSTHHVSYEINVQYTPHNYSYAEPHIYVLRYLCRFLTTAARSRRKNRTGAQTIKLHPMLLCIQNIKYIKCKTTVPSWSTQKRAPALCPPFTPPTEASTYTQTFATPDPNDGAAENTCTPTQRIEIPPSSAQLLGGAERAR